MIWDDISNSDLSDRKFHVCIIGSGPAGMTLAATLARRGFSIILLEAGGADFTDESQEYYRGDVIGDKYFDLMITRLRYFGGTSNHWGGTCRPLDADDFSGKPFLDAPGWPISKKDLDPYIKSASELLEVPSVASDIPFGDTLRQIHFVQSPPVRFAKKYRDEISKSQNLHLGLNAYAIDLSTDDLRITRATVKTASGRNIYVEADYFVVCAGGIENSRFLLWVNQINNGKIIKKPVALGRYWMEHPHFNIGSAILTGKLAVKVASDDKVYFSPTPAAMQRSQTLNCCLWFRLMPHEGFKKLVADVACIAPEWGEWVLRLAKKGFACGTNVYAVWEQEPLHSNRIELSDRKDAADVPTTKLYWKKSNLTRKTALQSGKLLGEMFAKNDIGRVRINDWLLYGGEFPSDDLLADHHHMGGTRMADDAQFGVVDKDCKVFGQENLYVGGSSVFSKAGCANPTFTIVQLSLRLADHLTDRLRV